MPSPIDENVAFFWPQFLPNADTLFDLLASSVEWDDRIRARRVASFGVPYNYSGTMWPEKVMPEMLQPMIDMVMNIVGYQPNNCLANYYPTGDSTMGYHSDSVDDLEEGTGISIISLGATRTISFRRETDRSEVHNLALQSGSMLHMTSAMQATWRHAILKAEDVTSGRISLTFRRIKPRRDDALQGE